MNRRVVWVGAIFLIICTWVLLKWTGYIGRQLSDGLNIRQSFPITSINDEFSFKIAPTSKGVYIYSGAFSYDEEDLSQRGDTLEFEAKITEKVCGATNELGSVIYNARHTGAKQTSKGFPRYGKVVRAPFLSSTEPICLDVEITKIPAIQLGDLELSVSAYNARPCWFVECFLD